MSGNVYASLCDLLCIGLLLPFVWSFCLSVFWGFFFSIVFGTCYHWWICLLVWMLSSFFLLCFNFFVNKFFYFNNFIWFYVISFFFLFFPPFSFEPCDWQGLGARAKGQAWAAEVWEPSSGYWSTRDFQPHVKSTGENSSRDLRLNVMTQFHPTANKLQYWTPHAKQLTRQEYNPTH